MRLSCAWFLAGCIAACYFSTFGLRPAAGQAAQRTNAAKSAAAPNAAAEIDEELARQRQIVERFVTVLERNPRRGTALDRIYGFHIENGSIEDFVRQLRDRVAAKANDGTGWMILGLVESQRGRDAAAVEALTKAKDLRPGDPLAAYYLGQSLVLVGQPEKAAAAFEEAIGRRPAQADLLEIFQSLGRVHQRAQRTQEALEVWNRLEKLFPGDARVQEQIAVTLVEEAQHAQALPRYEALAKNTTDDYRRTVHSLEAAELKVKLNRAKEGIADLEQLLARLNPESWLFREVRRKIEEVFLRTDDQDGLAKYYAAWLGKNPDDIEAMSRLARVLARQARVPEAQEWLEKALKLAPSRKELRLAFVEQLVDDQRYAEAIEQYVALDKADPNNPDYLRDWGKIALRDTSRPKEARQKEAEKVWRRLVAARPTDPLIATQVADLFRHAEMPDAALALYQKAVESAPTAPQYREYLGEYYHILKRPEEALATWRQIAAGNQRTATNVARLAEVYAQFGYLKESLAEIPVACELDARDFSLQLKAADLQIRGETYDAALASLTRAEKLAQNDEEREAVLSQQIKAHALENKLADLATELTQRTAQGGAAHGDLFLLARYREALHEYPEATKAIHGALKLEPNHIRSLASAARIAEQSGDLKAAADLNRKLAIVDRRSRSEYLEHVATLETQLGRIDEAIAAGRELIAAAPGNVETYQFFADLCFRLNRAEDGLTALRRATRVNPNEPSLLLSLAAALAGQFRSDEAIELYWQAFEKHTQLDDKLGDIAKLTDLYLQTNHFDQLLERLERSRREADQRREMTICLAQAYQSAGDYGMARQELERLLSENTRDTQLLLQLSKLAETESDLATAVKYQEQLAKLSPGAETDYRLANLLSRAGNNQESAAIVVRLATKEENKEKLLRSIDGLLTSGEPETALAILEPKLRENSTDWELLYRQGIALAKRSPAEAVRGFQTLLDLAISDDELSTAAKAQQKKPKTQGPYSRPMTRRNEWRLDHSHEIRRATGLDQEPYYYGMQGRQATWMPSDFGQARMAAVGWLFRLARDAGQGDAFVAARRQRAEDAAAPNRELWDFVYLQTVRSDEEELRPIIRRLAEKGGRTEKVLYLTTLGNRGGQQQEEEAEEGEAAKDKTPPLEPEELEFALKMFQSVRGTSVDAVEAGDTVNSYAQWSTGTILRELARVGRKEEEQRLYRETVDRAATPDRLATAMQLAVGRDDRATALSIFDRLAAKDLQSTDNKSANQNYMAEGGVNTLTELIGSEKTPPAEVLQALDRYLTFHAAKNNKLRGSLAYRPGRLLSQPNNPYISIRVGKAYRNIQLTYPTPNEYYDQQGLTLLRTAFEVFRTKDLASDLVKHIQARSEKAPPAEKLYDLLALAYTQVWNDDRESAVETLASATAFVPQDTALRQEVARLNLEMSQLDEALAVVESIAPLDQRSMQQRETLALDLAVRLGDHQRAREAAQRLFGLRLDAESQITLAGQMRRLGMNEEAEAILSRAQRQAGSRLSALSALMGQYQAQGKMELAAQVAHQVLRRSRTAPASQAAMGYSSSDSQSRTAALACLAQAGKLKELISGVEEQIQRSPQATQLHETLSEYYQAAGETQKMLDLQAKIVSLRPDDGDLRYRYAQELYRRGKVNEACAEYLVVIKKQPRLIGNRYWEVSNAFQRARKEADLARALSEIDLKSIGQPYMVTNIIGNMMRSSPARSGNDSDGRTAGMVLFKKAWEAFPDQRSELMSNFYDTELWKLPEVLEYGKKSLLPTAQSVRQNPWYGVNSGIVFNSGGRITAVLQRVLDGAVSGNQLASLRAEVAAAVDQHPTWKAGPVLLAVIDLRQGSQPDMVAAMQPLMETKSKDYNLRYCRWVIAQELEAKPIYKELAIKLYELAATLEVDDDDNDQFQYTPGPRLVQLYKDAGRREDARKVLVRAVRHQPRRDGNYPYYVSQKAESLITIGGQLQELDLPVDALRAYRELLINPDFSDPSISNFSGRAPEYFHSQARAGIQAVIKKFGERPAAEVANAFLTPDDKARPGTPAIDLMIAAAPAGVSSLPSLDSPLVRLIRPTGMSTEAVYSIESQLDTLATKYPGDLSVPIAAALFALKGSDAVKIQAALATLTTLVEATPLESLPPGKRANARQRTEAAQQIGLWLVARECLTQTDRRSMSEPLAQRAIAAAQRQLDPAELVAVLYERGRLAFNTGDRAAGEKCWNELIDLVLVEPRLGKATATNAVESTSGAARGGKIPATLSQFKLGASIAQAAAENELIPLSLRAIREALSGGVPVADLPKSSSDGSAPRNIRQTTPGAPNSRGDIDQTVFSEMSSRMWQLSLAWKRHSIPPADVCQLLEEIVFPASRPGDVLIYEQPLNNDLSNPQSVGRLLVEWSIRAGRETHLMQQVAARQATPTDAVSGHVLLVQLHVARRETDSAREHLEAILKQIETSKLASLTGLAAHAAAATLGNTQLIAAGLPLLEKLASAPNPPGRSFVYGQSPTPSSPATIVTREYLKLGNAAAAQAGIDRLLQSRQEQYGRIIGDSASFYQRLDLAWAANELSRSGNYATTLAALSRFADVTASRERDVPVTALSVALWHLARQAQRLTPVERYELLRDWSLPTKDRRSVRTVSGFNSSQPIPTMFLGANLQPDWAFQPEPLIEPVSNLTLLVEAATEAGRLDELSLAVEPLAADKVPGAESLALLTLIARRDYAAAVPRLQALAARWQAEIPRPGAANANNNAANVANRQATRDVSEYLAARAALTTPELSQQGRSLCQLYLDLSRRMNLRELVTHVSYDLAQASVRSLPPAERDRALALPLALWTAGTGPRTVEGTLPPAMWTVHDGHLFHITGSENDALYLKTPLEGEFEFSYDTYTANYSLSGLGYGGTVCGGAYLNGPVQVASASQHEQLQRPGQLEAQDSWNHVAVRVSPTSARFYINGHMAYEDRSPARTSPWLYIQVQCERQPVMKNFRLTGNPTIPREVKLIDGDRLDGWNASFYGENSPPRLRKTEPAAENSNPNRGPYYTYNSAGEYVLVDPNAAQIMDWQAEAGVLDGRIDPAASPRTRSRLFYHRPLADGDRIAYQFLYEPGKTHVHPTLGRIAFLLDPSGLKLHWMTRATDSADPLLVDPRVAVEEPANRRGDGALPLRENDWNDVELAVTGDQLSIRLNGLLICERPIESNSDRRFGLFHFKGETAVKVRNVVLRGNWPQSLSATDQADLLAVSEKATSPAVQRARHALVGERLFTTAAYDVWKIAQEMPLAERYDLLKGWVLPSEKHPTIRLQFDWTPSDTLTGLMPRNANASRSHVNGELVSPAFELVAVAKELNKLDDLATAAAIAGKESSDQARPLSSFHTLLALARGDDQAVATGLKQATEIVKTQPPTTPLHERYPEYLAALAALGNPKARPMAKALAQEIVKDQQPPRVVNTEWSRRTPHLRALATWAADPATANIPFGQSPLLRQWQPVTRSTAQERGNGYPAGAWKLAAGEAICLSGSPRATLYHAVPLTGDFEVVGQVTTAANRTIRLLYGGFALAVNAEGKLVLRQEVGRTPDSRTPLLDTLKNWGPTVQYKLVVKDSLLTAFVNGQQIHSERLPANVDPWLAIETTTPNQTGAIKNLQILGSPSVPLEVALSNASELDGWIAAYYNETIRGEIDPDVQPNARQSAAWAKEAEEIVAGVMPNCHGSFRESVLQYHRPLLEDGEVEYEFFYEPGKTEVHPALDRLAFLLKPSGVQIHWLTDGPHERSGLTPDNAEPLRDARPVPLQAGQWNKLKLKLAGDEIALFVNDQEVARRTLEATNQRTFGLFRYADVSAVRVRQVVHRGLWPTALPSLNQQELATAPPAASNAKAKGKSKAKAN